MQIAGNILIFIGLFFIFFGTIGVFRFKNFYSRILVTANIDTVGTFTVIIGIVLKHGFSFFSLKLLLLILMLMVINPLIAHITAHSAHLSGFKFDNTYEQGSEDIG